MKKQKACQIAINVLLSSVTEVHSQSAEDHRHACRSNRKQGLTPGHRGSQSSTRLEILWLLRVTQREMHTIRNDSMKSAALLVVVKCRGGRGKCEHGLNEKKQEGGAEKCCI